MREQLKKEKQVVVVPKANTKVNIEREQPFTQELLSEAWGKMQKSNIAGNNQFYKIILEDGEPEIVGKHSIVVNLHNKILKEPFGNFKPVVFKFLSNELLNDRLHIDINIVPPKKGKKRIYTAHEKFEHLAEINPALLTLRNKLGLDFDQ